MDDEKPLGWIGSSKKDLMELPEEIRKMIGYSLHLAQWEKDDTAQHMYKERTKNEV